MATLAPSALLLALAAAPGAAPAQQQILVVVPVGAPSPELVELVADSLESRFVFDVRVTEAVLMPPHAWYPPRKRWRAEKILDALDALDIPGAWRVAGITEKEISTTKGAVHDWGIAGLGSLGGKSSIFSSYLFRRFRTVERAKYLRYMENLVLHEVGHTLGLDHCPRETCLMADAKGNAIRAAERSNNQFCPRCAEKIARYLR